MKYIVWGGLGAALGMLLALYVIQIYIGSYMVDKTSGHDPLNYPLIIDDNTRADLCAGLSFTVGKCNL